MKKRTIILVLMVLMAATSPFAYAVEKHTPTPVSSTSKSTPSVATQVGTIANIDAKSLKLSSADGSSSTITIDPAATSVWKMGKSLPISDLKVGEKVKVRRTTKNGKDVAKSIEVL